VRRAEKSGNNEVTSSCTDTPAATAVEGKSVQGTGVSGEGEFGVEGLSHSATGSAGLFRNTRGGDIIQGIQGNFGARMVFRVDPSGNLLFGAQTRQMLSLWKNNQTEYGIGVQNFGLYQRTGSDFFWYKGGTHSDTFGDAGGGTLLMHLDDTGNLLFGAQTRQMINLIDTTYGIGVQADAFYQRTGNEFFWYKGGTHSDTFGDAGGGQQLMRLGNSGALIVSGRVVTPVLQITGGADVAEPFQMSREDIPKGAVVIIDEENAGHLKLSEAAYDKRVAGIVSGANGINPGISLSQQGVSEGGQHVALSGHVYVLADASSSPIKPGDLLTTSGTPGYAMKVNDHARAQGAVIGKAMSAMKEGKGMVLVLVTLQ
jgi:hypothetical protein